MRSVLAICAFPLCVLSACSGDKDTGDAPAPTLSFLAPAEGATVAQGTVDVTIVVENFVLETPLTATNRLVDLLPGGVAYAHNDGEAEGYAALTLDGADAGLLTGSQGTLEGVAAGSHTLTAELYYSDGDKVEPPVAASVTFTAE